jgi:hypothetical protein
LVALRTGRCSSTGWRGTTLPDGESLIENGQNLADQRHRSNMSGFVTCFESDIYEITIAWHAECFGGRPHSYLAAVGLP